MLLGCVAENDETIARVAVTIDRCGDTRFRLFSVHPKSPNSRASTARARARNGTAPANQPAAGPRQLQAKVSDVFWRSVRAEKTFDFGVGTRVEAVSTNGLVVHDVLDIATVDADYDGYSLSSCGYLQDVMRLKQTGPSLARKYDERSVSFLRSGADSRLEIVLSARIG